MDIVVWPTTSCFADWSKRRHVTLSIIECRTIHDNLLSDISRDVKMLDDHIR